MEKRINVIILFVLLAIHVTALPDRNDDKSPYFSLKRLAHNHNRNPLIVFIDSAKNQQSEDIFYSADDGATQEVDENGYEINPKEEAKEILYNYLRTSPEDNEDPTTEEKKQALRQALRARCKVMTTCKKKCPRRKKPSCPDTCQKKYDDQNLCEPPKPRPCKRPKCGKTMPPSWL